MQIFQNLKNNQISKTLWAQSFQIRDTQLVFVVKTSYQKFMGFKSFQKSIETVGIGKLKPCAQRGGLYL
jgi:hypothetical protein